MEPYLRDTDFTLYNGDALEVLRQLPDESVHCCLTSPPFFGLRDYGTGSWEGGDEGCDHKASRQGGEAQAEEQRKRGEAKGYAPGSNFTNYGERWTAEAFRDICGKCGARRVDQQIGLEATPDEWVDRLVQVFREVRRVLRSDGTLWVECGDSYNSGTSAKRKPSDVPNHGYWENGGAMGDERINAPGYKPKDLLGQPWLLAFALRADGWYLRQAIIWHKPNAMPESVRDRCTTSHSYVFLLSKSPRYFFDAEAIAEPAEWARWGDQTVPKYEGAETASGWMQPKTKAELQAKRGQTWEERKAAGATRGNLALNGNVGAGTQRGVHGEGLSHDLNRADGRKNARSVWTISTEGFREAHFATFPEALVERCILAGTSERGVCPECGAPWARETNVSYEKSPVHGAGSVVGRHYETGANNFDGAGMPRLNKRVDTLGWIPTCDCCPAEDPRHEGEFRRYLPCAGTVLDPFMGSGTTARVARRHGRKTIGIELNPDYCEMAARRLQQLSLLA